MPTCDLIQIETLASVSLHILENKFKSTFFTEHFPEAVV